MYVYAINDGIVYRGDASVVTMHLGTVWYADDPFVRERSDLFSETPPVVHNTTGREQPNARPLTESKRRGGKRG